MYVMTIHSISDPEAFWSRQLDLPEGTDAANRVAEL